MYDRLVSKWKPVENVLPTEPAGTSCKFQVQPTFQTGSCELSIVPSSIIADSNLANSPELCLTV